MYKFVSFGLTIKHKMAKVLTVSCSSHLLIETLGFGRCFKTKKTKNYGCVHRGYEKLSVLSISANIC